MAMNYQIARREHLILEYDEQNDPDQDAMSIAEEFELGTSPARFESNVKYR